MSDLKVTKGSPNIFVDLGFDAEEAQNLLLRSQTMMVISKWFEASGLTQVAAAKTLGLTQPRLNQMLKGKIGEFSLDALVNMATRAGMRVGLTIRPIPSINARTLRKTEDAPDYPRHCNLEQEAIYLCYIHKEPAMTITSVFTNNRSQAVRMPADLRLPEGVKRVQVRALGSDRIISPVNQTWDSFFINGPEVSEDFIVERAGQSQSERESL